jgi:hypothetical protein
MKKYEDLQILKTIKEDVIGTENTFYAWAVLLAVLGILAMGFVVSSPKVSFHGIAGSRETNVNFDYPIEIQRVLVNPGQKVQKGELLLEITAEGKGKEYIFAETDGIVGSVNFSKGEKAPAFSSLVTVSPEGPTYVQGWVHEALNSDIGVGSPVTVNSVNGHRGSVKGRVAGVGGRIVPMPERFNNNGVSGKLFYGREVLVEIESSNNLLLGERVVIKPDTYWLQSFVAKAEPTVPEMNRVALEMSQPKPIKVPEGIAKRSHIELSGAVYLEDMKKYLVASDDPGDKNPPWLFLLSDEGDVEDRPVTIPNVKKMKDAESISSEGEYTYVMSSLWAKGKQRKAAGSQFIRFKRQGLELTETEVLEFSSILRRLLEESRDPVVVELMRHKDRPIEVEAHSVQQGDLYIALKAPLLDNDDSVIVRVRDVNRLFEKNGEQSTVEPWRKLRFSEEGHRISDLAFVKGAIYVTTTRKKTTGGAFWTMNQNDFAPRLVRSYRELRPEGVAYNNAKNVFLVAFDGGDEVSHFQFLAGPKPVEKK